MVKYIQFISFILLLVIVLLGIRCKKEKIVHSEIITKYACNFDIFINKIKTSPNSIMSSSKLKNEGMFNYKSENLIDQNLNTCWCPQRKSSNGVNEFIIMKIPFGTKGFKIIIGNAKNRKLYELNNRPKVISWGIILEKNMKYPKLQNDICNFKNKKTKYTNLIYYIEHLKDTFKSQYINITQKGKFNWKNSMKEYAKNYYLLIGIERIYKGSKYNDTCITEVEIIK